MDRDDPDRPLPRGQGSGRTRQPVSFRGAGRVGVADSFRDVAVELRRFLGTSDLTNAENGGNGRKNANGGGCFDSRHDEFFLCTGKKQVPGMRVNAGAMLDRLAALRSCFCHCWERRVEHRQLKKMRRAEALARRDALDAVWRIEASLAIAEIGAKSIAVGPDAVVSGFWPIRSEVDVRPLLFSLREVGARLCLPAIVDRTTIVFRELVRGAPIVDMGFGTRGPSEDAAILDPTVMLVPLAAFDRRGHRIGYGAGHYDRAIARLHAKGVWPRLVGVAFACQEVPEVPDEAHDVVLDDILTERGIRKINS
jgi:5-formyltetrahydrofolate cyclo-ligase